MTQNYDALRSDALYYDYSSAATPSARGIPRQVLSELAP